MNPQKAMVNRRDGNDLPRPGQSRRIVSLLESAHECRQALGCGRDMPTHDDHARAQLARHDRCVLPPYRGSQRRAEFRTAACRIHGASIRQRHARPEDAAVRRLAHGSSAALPYALGHHRDQVAIAQPVRDVPANAGLVDLGEEAEAPMDRVARDALLLAADAPRAGVEEIAGQARPSARHEVHCLDRTQCDHAVLATAVAHQRHRQSVEVPQGAGARVMPQLLWQSASPADSVPVRALTFPPPQADNIVRAPAAPAFLRPG